MDNVTEETATEATAAGDPVCFLDLVCPECGGIHDAGSTDHRAV